MVITTCQTKKQLLSAATETHDASAETSTSSVAEVRLGATTRSRSRHASFVRIHKGSPTTLNHREIQTFESPNLPPLQCTNLVVKKSPTSAKKIVVLQTSISQLDQKAESYEYVIDSVAMSHSKIKHHSVRVAPMIKSEPPELVPGPPILRRVDGHATKFNTYDTSIHSEEKLVLSSLANLTTDQVLAQQSPSLFLLGSPLSLIKQRQLQECTAIQQTITSSRLECHTKTTNQTDTTNNGMMSSTTAAGILFPNASDNFDSDFFSETSLLHPLEFWSPQPIETMNKVGSNSCISTVEIETSGADNVDSFDNRASPKELFPASMLTGQIIQTDRGVAVLLLPQSLQERVAIARLAQCGAINDSSSSQQQPLDSRNRRWTAAEDLLLTHAVQELRGVLKWKEIARTYFPGTRTANQCKTRWNKRLDPNIDRKPFTSEEDQSIIALKKQGVPWAEIASALGGSRRSEQVKNRFVSALDPNRRKSAPWSDEEDRILNIAQTQLGNKWSEIAKRLPGRSDNDVKNHWYNMKHKQMRQLMKQRQANRRQAQLTHIRQTKSTSSTSLDYNDGTSTAKQCNPVG